MFPQNRIVVAALAISCFFASSARANTIDLNTLGVVGAVEGKMQGGTNPVNEELIAERLLWMGPNQTLMWATPALSCNATLSPCEYKTGNNDYPTSDLTYVGKHDYTNTETPNIEPDHLGNVYVLAKYDGQNAGYILFYLPDWNASAASTIDNRLPEFPADIFDGKYRITHYAAFSPVPDGGTTLLLLGGALVGLGAFRRRFNKV